MDDDIPASWKVAKIILLPKADHDLSCPQSYRPVSFFNTVGHNTNFKVEQFYFSLYPSRSVRRYKKIISCTITLGDCPILFGLPMVRNCWWHCPAEKAFDRVEWAILKMMDFGAVFMTWINLIYSAQFVIIFLEGYQSTNITVERGVRQGCPIFPILVNLVIEV